MTSTLNTPQSMATWSQEEHPESVLSFLALVTVSSFSGFRQTPEIMFSRQRGLENGGDGR